ncbi:hypothetical protein GQ457_18G015990 [Hibiscus cannabinus]
MTDSGSNHVISYDALSDTNWAEKEQPEPKSQTKVGDKRKSEYWSHSWDIRDLVIDKVVKAKCKYCSKVLIANTENGTSNLKKHIGSCPNYPLNIDKKQKLISVFRASPTDTPTVIY